MKTKIDWVKVVSTHVVLVSWQPEYSDHWIEYPMVARHGSKRYCKSRARALRRGGTDAQIERTGEGLSSVPDYVDVVKLTDKIRRLLKFAGASALASDPRTCKDYEVEDPA